MRDEDKQRKILYGVAAVVALLLLGPYIGIHVFSNRPALEEPATPEKTTRKTQPARSTIKKKRIKNKKTS